ncbi:MAG TPA: tyrosine-type recombinase/integrase [Ktedonobacterales bacterium]
MKIDAAIKGFLMDWELRGRSPATIRLYRSCLNVVARWLESQGISASEDVTINNLRAFILETQQRPAGSINPRRPQDISGNPPTPATMQSYVKAIKLLFKWLVEEEVIGRNPALRLHKPTDAKRVVVTFSHDHLNALFGSCDLSTALGFRDYVIMLALLDTGMRVSELCGVTLDDVHEGYIKVFSKGRKEREVGVSPTTAKFLWKYVHLYRAQADDEVRALFTSIAGKPLTPWGVDQVLQRVREAAGIEDVKVTAHKFRHTFARTWLERGGEVYSLSRLMGHSSVKITEIYLEDFKSRQARVQHAKFSPINGLKLRQRGTGKHTYNREPRTGGADDNE